MFEEGEAKYSPETATKLSEITMIYKTHMSCVKGIQTRYSHVEPHYEYGDLNAGPGRYLLKNRQEPLYGSPIIALRTAHALALPLRMACYEHNPATMQALKEQIAIEQMQYGTSTQMVDFYDGNNRIHALTRLADIQQRYNKTVYGLLYCDENGISLPWQVLAAYAQALPKMDMLIYVSATAFKRSYYSSVHDHNQRLDELIAPLPKNFWIVRRPHTSQHWTFLLGTNWESFPKFRRQGFWPTNSPEGQDILRKLIFNRTEYNGQGDLFSL